MIPVIGRRRTVPSAPAGYRVFGITSHGDSGRQVPGRLPEWPADWPGRYPLDPAVFGSVPVAGKS